MPIKRRVPKQRSELTPSQYAFLYDMPPPKMDETDPVDTLRWWWLMADHYDHNRESSWFGDGTARASDLWRLFGDQVLADWAVESPGTRPTAWWRFSAPDRRPADGETEAAYLRRHRLFLPGEEERLTGRDFGPETVEPDGC